MAIQAQLNYNTRNNNLGLPLLCAGSDFSWINNGCNGGFDEICLNLQQKHQQLHQRNQNPQQVSSDERFQYQGLAAHMERQEQEIDQFIRSQNERLRFLVHEQRRHQMQGILKTMEAKASVLLRQKDLEVAELSGKTMELEALLQKLETENQRWQKLAKENGAMVVSLKNSLQQVREKASLAVEDEGSCCGGGEEAEGCLDGGKWCEKTGMVVCRSCGSGETCVLFLPCRHLCSCRDCEAYLDSCPVCGSPKKAIIEALIF